MSNRQIMVLIPIVLIPVGYLVGLLLVTAVVNKHCAYELTQAQVQAAVASGGLTVER